MEKFLSLFTQIAILATALVGLYVSLQNRRKLGKVHEDVNGKIAQLIEATGAQREAAGEATGREKALSEQRARTAESERKEDRVAAKVEEVKELVQEHDQWERGTKEDKK